MTRMAVSQLKYHKWQELLRWAKEVGVNDSNTVFCSSFPKRNHLHAQKSPPFFSTCQEALTEMKSYEAFAVFQVLCEFQGGYSPCAVSVVVAMIFDFFWKKCNVDLLALTVGKKAVSDNNLPCFSQWLWIFLVNHNEVSTFLVLASCSAHVACQYTDFFRILTLTNPSFWTYFDTASWLLEKNSRTDVKKHHRHRKKKIIWEENSKGRSPKHHHFFQVKGDVDLAEASQLRALSVRTSELPELLPLGHGLSTFDRTGWHRRIFP